MGLDEARAEALSRDRGSPSLPNRVGQIPEGERIGTAEIFRVARSHPAKRKHRFTREFFNNAH
jgi:hypothetical protein